MTVPSGHSPDEAVRDPDEEARKALTLFERQLEANQPMIRRTSAGRRVQKTRVSSKGQVTIPKHVRDSLGLTPGTESNSNSRMAPRAPDAASAPTPES